MHSLWKMAPLFPGKPIPSVFDAISFFLSSFCDIFLVNPIKKIKNRYRPELVAAYAMHLIKFTAECGGTPDV